jgi:hypothetical protein
VEHYNEEEYGNRQLPDKFKGEFTFGPADFRRFFEQIGQHPHRTNRLASSGDFRQRIADGSIVPATDMPDGTPE